MRHARLALTALCGAVALGACESDTAAPPATFMPAPELADQMGWDKKAGLLAAQSCDDALGMLHQMATTDMLLSLESQRRYAHESATQQDDYPPREDASAGGAGDPGAAASAAESHSETTAQIEGVEEADIVKTDGHTIYTLVGDELILVQAWSADSMAELARVAVPGWGHSLHLSGDRVVVLSIGSREILTGPSTLGPLGGVFGPSPASIWDPVTVVTVVDVSDPAAPTVAAQHAFEGNLQATRRIGDRLYLVQMSRPPLDALESWPSLAPGASVADIHAAFTAMRARNEARIAETTLEDWLPAAYEADPNGVFGPGELVTPCTAVYGSVAFSGAGVITTITMGLGADAAAPYGASVGGSWSTVMMSREALYLASTNYAWWFYWEDDPDAVITTQLHELALDGLTGRATWVASGLVPGTVLDQFAMDEYQGRLRVATAIPDWRSDAVNTNEGILTVLEPQGEALAQTGQVGGLGKGGLIRSVRLVGDRGYVETFRQSDPLTVVDLTDPAAPAVSGELQASGFSTYIHPLDDAHLLTIGTDTTDQGQGTGMLLQIFDVSDPTAPKQTHAQSYDAGWGSWSEAQWDHHAFVYYPSRKLLALPMFSREGANGESLAIYHSVLRLFRVDVDDGVQEAGVVDHDGLVAMADPQQECFTWSWMYSSQSYIRRGVFVEDTVYAVSSLGVTAHDVDDLEADPVATVSLMSPASIGNCATYPD